MKPQARNHSNAGKKRLQGRQEKIQSQARKKDSKAGKKRLKRRQEITHAAKKTLKRRQNKI